MTDAVHAEYGRSGSAVVAPLACPLDGVDIEVDLAVGSRLRSLHGGVTSVLEHATCNYGLASAWQQIADQEGMAVAAVDHSGGVRAIERPGHPFFLATLYQPQLRSSPEHPHPIFVGFVAAAAQRPEM